MLGITLSLENCPAEYVWQGNSTNGAYICCDSTTERLETISRSFGARDAKGREIGGRVIVSREILTPRLASTGNGRISKQCGEWLVATPHALRDGERFGASQRDHRFLSQADLDAYVAKYFADAEKRAHKAAAKVAA